MKRALTTILSLVVTTTFAQLNWQKGGNNAGPPGSQPIIGTNASWNVPLLFHTNGSNRMRLNGTLTTTINSVSQDVSGFLGIGPGGWFATHTPMTMLHLQGTDNSNFAPGGGWRRWMKTGVFLNENSDAMYIGMKPEAGTNRSDAVIGWNDDAGSGEDKLRFIFTATNIGASGNGNGTINPIDGKSLDGYEFMRMSSSPNQPNSAGYPGIKYHQTL